MIVPKTYLRISSDLLDRIIVTYDILILTTKRWHDTIFSMKRTTLDKIKKEAITADLFNRIVSAIDCEEAWKEARKIYGKEAAEELQKLTPVDPGFLHAYIKSMLFDDGHTNEEANEILNSYTHDDWRKDMRHVGASLKRIKKDIRTMPDIDAFGKEFRNDLRVWPGIDMKEEDEESKPTAVAEENQVTDSE